NAGAAAGGTTRAGTAAAGGHVTSTTGSGSATGSGVAETGAGTEGAGTGRPDPAGRPVARSGARSMASAGRVPASPAVATVNDAPPFAPAPVAAGEGVACAASPA